MNKKRLNGSNIINNLKSIIINFGYDIKLKWNIFYQNISIIRFQLFNDQYKIKFKLIYLKIFGKHIWSIMNNEKLLIYFL